MLGMSVTEEPVIKYDDDSSSDSDVILVEREVEEIIELSDNETNSNDEESLSDDVVSSLRKASHIMRTNKIHKTVYVEIPNEAWSISWNSLCTLYDSASGTKKPSDKRTQKPNCSQMKNIQRKSNEQVFVTSNKINHTMDVEDIKKEKSSEENDQRPLSVFYLDVNKPPVFCEISRSGRVIKKPNWLTDDITFFRRANQRKRKSSGEKDKITNPLESGSDKSCDNASEEDNNNSNLNSESETVNFIDNDFLQNSTSSQSLVSEKSNSSFEGTDRNGHNEKERIRRSRNNQLLIGLQKAIFHSSDKPAPDFGKYRLSKASTLMEALKTIQSLSMNLRSLENHLKFYKEQNNQLTIQLEFLKTNVGNLSTIP